MKTELAPVRVPGPGTMLIGFTLLGIQPLAVRALAGHVASPAVVFFRFGFALLAIAVICLMRGRGLHTAQPRILLLRGLLGGMAVLAYFGSIQLAGAGRGTVLNYTYPVWANLFAVVFLGHRPPRAFWALLGIAIVGVVLVAWPDEAQLLGARGPFRLDAWGRGELLGVFSAFSAGGAVLTIKLLRETDESLSIIAGFSGFGAALALPFALMPELLPVLEAAPNAAALPTGRMVLLMLTVGAFSFFGHVFFTRGYRGTSVQLGTVLSLSVPVIATSLGVLLLNEELSTRFLVGALLVLLACWGISRLETQGAKKDAGKHGERSELA